MKAREPDFKEEEFESFLDQTDGLLKKYAIEGYPERTRQNYQLYIYFCERIVGELLIEDATR